MKRKKIVIIGASGYLGKTIYHTVKDLDLYSVTGTCYSKESTEFISVDVMDTEALQRVIENNPDIIIWSVMNQEHEQEITTRGLKKLIELIPSDVRFIYLSTTVGIGRDQTEKTIPKVRDHQEYLYEYINGKIEGERLVKTLKNHVIVRPGSIYGYGYQKQLDSRMRILMEKYNKGVTYRRTDNLYSSFIHIEDLTNAIVELISSNFTGVINIAGSSAVSHYSFNRNLAGIMGINTNFIKPDYIDKSRYHNLSPNLRKEILKTQIRDITV